MKMKNIRVLSGNVLKIIAALTMLTDHVGMLLFPGVRFLRIVGRLAFPIFAFFIAEGCRYTRSKLRYFLTVALSGIAFQVVYTLFTGDDYVNIFITFALAIPLIYLLSCVKGAILKGSAVKVFMWTCLLLVTAAAVWYVHARFTVSYGLEGTLVSVASSLFSPPDGYRGMDEDLTLTLNVMSAGVALAYMSMILGGVQIYCLLAVPLLLLYSGKRGKMNLKYFFYVFYPVHLVILQGLLMLIK